MTSTNERAFLVSLDPELNGADRVPLEEEGRYSVDSGDRIAKAIETAAQSNLELSRQIAEQQATIEELMLRQQQLETSTSYLLGKMIVESAVSLPKLLTLPFDVVTFGSKRLAKRLGFGNQHIDATAPINEIDLRKRMLASVRAEDLAGARQVVEAAATQSRVKANLLTMLAREVQRADVQFASSCAREAFEADPRDFRRKWLAFFLFNTGSIVESEALLSGFSSELRRSLSARERGRALEVEGDARLLRGDWRLSEYLAPPQNRTIPATPELLVYVSASALPYHVTGYTNRTHGVVRGIKQAGWSVVCLTRPGYPDDRNDCEVAALGDEWLVDDVCYQKLPAIDQYLTAPDEYFERAATALEEKFREIEPSVVQAASNYMVGIPALIAARRLGIPFVYEVRGLWELTAATKNTGWEETDRFALSRNLESELCSNADFVLTLTGFLKDELVSRGAVRERVGLLPNGAELERFSGVEPMERSLLGLRAEDFVVGYAGSIVDYEGLDDLVQAVKQLSGDYPRVRVVIFGVGKAKSGLEAVVEKLSLQDVVLFPGRLEPDQIPAALKMFDVYAIPRKPFQVCHLVSPLKPLEAMASHVPILCSDVGGLREQVIDRENGLVFEAGNSIDCALKLRELIEDPALRKGLALAGFRFLTEERTWSSVTAKLPATYQALS